MLSKTPLVLLLALILGFAAGCSDNASSSPGANAQVAAAPVKSGAELWAENCSRCHNFRPPQSFSTTQWHAVVHHMRERANLTGQEAREITVFLQSTR